MRDYRAIQNIFLVLCIVCILFLTASIFSRETYIIDGKLYLFLYSAFSAIGGILGYWLYNIFEKEKKSILKTVLCSIIMLITFEICLYIISRTFELNTVFRNISIAITIAVLAFTSISDISTFNTYTFPIYASIVIISILEIIGIYLTYESIVPVMKYMLSLFIAFELCYVLSRITKDRWIGGGDLDITALIFVTNQLLGIFLLVCSYILILKKAIQEKMQCRAIKNKNSEAEIVNTDEEKKSWKDRYIPFVPVLYASYLLFVQFCM